MGGAGKPESAGVHVVSYPRPGYGASDIQAERDSLARRVDSLWRQRQRLIKLLAQIEQNGGVSPKSWSRIDRVLRAAGIRLANQAGRVDVMQTEDT